MNQNTVLWYARRTIVDPFIIGMIEQRLKNNVSIRALVFVLNTYVNSEVGGHYTTAGYLLGYLTKSLIADSFARLIRYNYHRWLEANTFSSTVSLCSPDPAENDDLIFGSPEAAVEAFSLMLPDWLVRLSPNREQLWLDWQELNEYGLIVNEQRETITLDYLYRDKTIDLG